MKKGKLIIISGPSGVGKSTIRKEIINNLDNIWYSVSATTRSPRDGEKHEVDYFFLTEDEFKNQIALNNFIEYVEVYKGTFYGTLKSKVMEKLNNGVNVILEIDVIGALKVKEKFNDAILIYIAPPSFEVLEERLTNRATDSKDKIKERIEKAKYELSMQDKYDYIVINEDLDKAIKDITHIITNL